MPNPELAAVGRDWPADLGLAPYGESQVQRPALGSAGILAQHGVGGWEIVRHPRHWGRSMVWAVGRLSGTLATGCSWRIPLPARPVPPDTAAGA